ncbi:uncharacterized protein LOC131259884 [Anopheles coustani]|uniref:uncharacterized protein LOC131259884 n=1 Tax=Anopheles coustani TaxID=139045 RepID=UPI002658CD87|nr:uncharacterized protein LOC131259884 [Anopheles coustani]
MAIRMRPTVVLVMVVAIGCTGAQQPLGSTSSTARPLDGLSPPTPAGPIAPGERQFRVVYEWNVLDFAFPSEAERAHALYSGRYIPKNVLISDCKPYANRLYLTVPRMLPGVPATLGYIVRPENNGRTDPEIVPFPSWDMNERGNCSALQFVQGVAVDKHGIMWVVDSGRTETLTRGTDHVVCPPKILLLDLKRNGAVILRYQFPESVVPAGNNYLNKVVVDDAFGGFAYITDNSGADPGIVVFSRRLLKSWKVRENNSMRAARNAVRFAINGTELNYSIHIDSIALGPYYNPNVDEDRANGVHSDTLLNSQNYERNVYYSPLSSYHVYSLPASLLRDPEFNARATPQQVLEAVVDYGQKLSQTDGMFMDNQGVLYFGLLGENAIAKWDTYKPFTAKNQQIVAKDPTYIQWVDSMGIDHEGYLYVVVNRLHSFVAGRLNPAEVNFRVLRAKTGALSYVYTPDNLFNSDEKYLYAGANGEPFADNALNYQYEGTTPASSRLAAAGILGATGTAPPLGSSVGVAMLLSASMMAMVMMTSSFVCTDHVVCPPKILLLDLKRNGAVILRYQFPESVVPAGNNYLNKVVVDDAFGGFAYITDNSGADPGIVVFSRRLLKSWKVRENNSMRAARNAVRFAINGTELNYSIHIDSIALGPYYNPNVDEDRANGVHSDTLLNSQNYERNVYYSPLSSYHVYSLPASLLRDPEFNARATPQQVLEAVVDYGQKLSQTDGMFMDNQGVLYFGLLGENAIAKWDTYKPFTAKNQQIVAKDPTYIQWVDSMGIDHEGYLYVVVNRLHSFVAGRLNPAEVNFRVLRAKTGALSYVYTPDNLFNSDEKYLYAGANGEPFADNALNYQYEGTTPASSRLAAAGILGATGTAPPLGSSVGVAMLLSASMMAMVMMTSSFV